MGLLDLFRSKKPQRAATRAFAGARVDRLTASWLAGEQSINDALRGDLDRLRARARDMAQNNDYARRFLRMVARNVVGPNGFVLQSRVEDAPGQPDRLANQAIEAAFWRWSRRGSCEVSGRMGFADLQRAAIMAVARDGEALLRIVRGPAANNPERFALQLVDVGRLDTMKNRAPERSGGNVIVMGVEMDAWQRPVAYWLKPKLAGADSERVPADEILHVFVPEDAEQVRGLPWMHAALLALHDLNEFNRSALIAARKGADTLGFIFRPPLTPEELEERRRLREEAGEEAAIDEQLPLKLSAPGSFDVLPEGYDIRAPEFAYPNDVYADFVKACLRRVASGLDVSYNALGNDLEGVNYSSLREGKLQDVDQWLTLQAWFVEACLEPVFDEWLSRALTAGSIVMPNGSALPAAKIDKFRAHEWQGRRWAWVDPLKDVTAARLAVASGVASPQMIAAQSGVDVEDVLASIAAFESLAKAYGVTMVDYGKKTADAVDGGA